MWPERRRPVLTALAAASLCLLLLACGASAAQRNNAGNSSYQRGSYTAALRAYQLAQVSAPDRPEPYYNAAAAYFQLDRINEAIAALEEALDHADDDMAARAYYNLGNIFVEIGLCAEAVESYQQALLLRPDDADARYNLELALRCIRPPTPTAIEQQTEPEQGQTDPETTPTGNPGGQEGPTPTPPPLEMSPEPSATARSGSSAGGDIESGTPTPQPGGPMSVERAEALLDSIQQNQQTMRQYLQDEAGSGQPSEKDW